MSEYIGAMQGIRLRRQDDLAERRHNLSEKTHDFSRNMRIKQHRLSQDSHTFSKNSALRREKRNESEIAKRDSRYNQDRAERKHRNSLSDNRLAGQDKRNEDIHNRNIQNHDTAKAEKTAQMKVGSMSHDVIDDVVPFLLGKSKQLKKFRGYKRDDNGFHVKDVRGEMHSFSPTELGFMVNSYKTRQNATLKNKQLQQKHNFKLQQDVQKQRLKMQDDVSKNPHYFVDSLVNQGYDTSDFKDKDGKETVKSKRFIQAVQYFRNQNMGDNDAIKQAAMHTGIRRGEDYQAELGRVEAEMKDRANETSWFTGDTDRYDELQDRQTSLQEKIASMSKNRNLAGRARRVKENVIRRAYKGKIAVYDANTKQFLRYE